MIKSKKIIFIIISAVIIFSIIILSMPYVKKINSNMVWEDNEVSERESYLIDFINNKMLEDNGGIKTNYKEAESEGDITKGRAVLSESEGIMMLYYVDRNDKDEFEKIVSYIKENMILENGLISWRIEDGERSQSSAAIDDLRIIKSLLLASERWNSFKYRSMALNIAKSLKKQLLDKNLLADFNDGNSKSNKTTICYLDILTLKLLSNLDNSYKEIYNNSLKIMNEAYLGDSFPLYAREYDRESKDFDNEDVDMLLSSIVILNRAQSGEDVSKSVEWINKKFKEQGGIYSLYDRDTGQAVSTVESTSIYSNLMQIAYIVKDEELYKNCIEKLKAYQVLNIDSEIYGAYGDTKTLEVFSFDNLNALLAWRKYKDN